MPTLTSDQILHLRDDLGDKKIPYAFTDDELQRNYDRLDGDYDTTLLLCLRQLLMDASKFYDYASGFTRQEQSKVFANLKTMYEVLQQEVKSKNQALIVAMRSVPPKGRKTPKDA